MRPVQEIPLAASDDKCWQFADKADIDRLRKSGEVADGNQLHSK